MGFYVCYLDEDTLGEEAFQSLSAEGGATWQTDVELW